MRTVLPQRQHRPRRQRGAALLTAMIIVTLVATLAAGMVWQQWRAVQVEGAERARAQSAWVLYGALDFARLILKETAHPGKPVTLNDPWATPLAESRLSTFLAVDKANADDGPEAFLSGSISDAQARYNLRNLVTPTTPTTPATTDKLEVQTLERLCGTLGIDIGIATRIANGLRDAKPLLTGTTPATAPLDPQTVAQLAWFGIDTGSLQALQPYVALLPAGTYVNVNTASKEVLAAVFDLGLGTADSLVQARLRTPFKSKGEFTTRLASTPPPTAKFDVQSSYFEVRGRLRLADHVLTERSMVQRGPKGEFVPIPAQRERIASLEQVGS
jgi:general secretion pathway protein K